jgi:protocatechuate 3,4-dioxygenase beta subunit
MKSFLLAPCILLCLAACAQQQTQRKNTDTKAGGPCEGCEAIYESPVPFELLNEVDTLPDFNDGLIKMIISGTVFKADGITPAPGVVLYIYHTDQMGNYAIKGNDPSYRQDGWAKRHGYNRGWAKTNEKGQYTFFTIRPASYPNSKAPQHIHPVVKEPGISEYYIDEFLFDDDPNLTSANRSNQEQRGGNGIVTLTNKNNIFYGKRDIYLGKNIPGYQK